jgi:hypothetical protein
MPTLTLNFDPTYLKFTYERESDHVKICESVDLMELMTILPERINELLCTVPAKTMFWASISEQVIQHMKELKNNRDSRLGTVSLEIRNKWDEAKQGKKTEKAIEDLSKSDEEYCRLVAELEQAEYFALQTTRVKETLQMVNSNLAILSANLRQSGEPTLSTVPVFKPPYAPPPQKAPDATLGRPPQKAPDATLGRPTRMLRRTKPEDPVQ